MARTEEGIFTSKDNTRLFWRSQLPEGEPTAVVGVVHGYCDHSGRYLHVMNALAASGFAVAAFDYRGHGKAEGKRVDVEKWDDFLDDLAVFWGRVRALAPGKPAFILAHSHGALMTTHWALKKPEGLTGVVLSSPYYRLAFDPPAFKLAGAKLLRKILPGVHISNELSVTQLSRDEAWQKFSAEDPLYEHTTTPRHFFETLASQERLIGRGAEFTTPVYMVAGEADGVASMPAMRAFFDTMASPDKTWKSHPEFRHEVMNEIGKERVLADIVEWISARR
ncbi:MAG: lysophospholipase [Archangium sp.]|nr:lysophospholipase [Archangium sp.]